MKLKFLFALIVVCLMACDNSFNAENLADSYCDCMGKNNAEKDFSQVYKKCERLISENRYMRLWTIDMKDTDLDKRISEETRDSVRIFIERFDDYTLKYCCKDMPGCPDSMR